MARSPFQGTFQPNIRPTITNAPDAVVYINGESEVIGCPQCTRTFDLNKYITSIQLDLSVESAPGSASISLSIPRHSIDDFYFDGNPIITTMMEVEIYAKGYYLVEGMPQYYPVFWGLITEVGDNYSGGEHTVSINCSDILKWWELCNMNINPAFIGSSGQQGRNLFGNVFNSTNPYDIIFTLANVSFGDIVTGAGSMNAIVRERNAGQNTDAALADMMLYWEKRFARMRSNLVLYGTNGVAVRGETLFQRYSRDGVVDVAHLASTVVNEATGSPGDGTGGGQFAFNPAAQNVTSMKTVISNAGQMNLWQAEYQTKLELANAAKEAIGFEFYMDVTGDIVFKPPFYNLDVLGNKPVSWIQDIDVIDWNFSESESEVVTQITMQGEYGGTVDFGLPQEVIPLTTVTDYHLLRKYGWRSHPYNSEFMSDPQMMFLHGMDIMDRLNARRHRATITIPMRPELRLGFPIYVAPKDQIWYISGISHNISFGGRATTALSLTARRSKFIAPKGIGNLRLEKFSGVAEADKDGLPRTFRYSSRQLAQSGVFSLDATNTASIPADSSSFQDTASDLEEPMILRHPKTGRIMGYPNVVMAYTRPFAPADLSEQAGLNRPEHEVSQLSAEQQETIVENRDQHLSNLMNKFNANVIDEINDKYLGNRYQYGLNSAGVFVYAHDTSNGGGVISEVLLLPSASLKVKSSFKIGGSAGTVLIRPVSDERGFEVVGNFQYGRRVSLRDGRLIHHNPNLSAKIDVQLAISGDLAATLTAQSQGLSTITTGYDDPASVLANLAPDDLQTAATLDTDSPKFVNVGDNFVRTATLGSPEQKGATQSVEASQLSRALTLAELSVKDLATLPDENCVCVTGRGDLAFMAQDYQVASIPPDKSKVAQEPVNTLLNDVLGDVTESQPINVAGTAQARKRVDFLQAQYKQLSEQLASAQEGPAEGISIDELPEAVRSAYTQALSEMEDKLSELQLEIDDAEDELTELLASYSSTSLLTKNKGELINRIDQWLVNLYSALDLAHQQLESALRGDLMPGQEVDTSGLSGAAINPPSEFAPPFSAPNRFMLGDVNALVGNIETNANNISQAWSQFGTNLKKNSENTALSTQISQDQKSIKRLTAARDHLVLQSQTNVAVVGYDVQKQIATYNREIGQLEQEIAANRAKLSGA
jgi:hypothetical protein